MPKQEQPLDLVLLHHVADEAETIDKDGIEEWYLDADYTVRVGAGRIVVEAHDQDEANHIAIFDPTTTKQLITRVVEAERRQCKAEDFLAMTNRSCKRRDKERDQLKARVAELEARTVQVEAWRDMANIGCHLLSYGASGEFTYVRYEEAIKKARALDTESAASEPKAYPGPHCKRPHCTCVCHEPAHTP